jgi:hypothetical protein
VKAGDGRLFLPVCVIVGEGVGSGALAAVARPCSSMAVNKPREGQECGGGDGAQQTDLGCGRVARGGDDRLRHNIKRQRLQARKTTTCYSLGEQPKIKQITRTYGGLRRVMQQRCDGQIVAQLSLRTNQTSIITIRNRKAADKATTKQQQQSAPESVHLSTE